MSSSEEKFPRVLRGGIWHTTSEDRYKAILNSGAILPEPHIPDSERWGTLRGPAFFPYVRYLGGVSIFDFTDFDPISYSEQFPNSSWHTFVPKFRNWDRSVWIRLDSIRGDKKYLTAAEVLARWNAEKAYPRKIMPMIEAAYLGSIDCQRFDDVYVYSDSCGWLGKPGSPFRRRGQ